MWGDQADTENLQSRRLATISPGQRKMEPSACYCTSFSQSSMLIGIVCMDIGRHLEEGRGKEASKDGHCARTRAAMARTRLKYADLEICVKRPCIADEDEKTANNGDMRLLYDIS